MKVKATLLTLGILLFLPLVSSQFTVSPRTLDEYHGSFPNPVHFLPNFTQAKYRITNDLGGNITIDVQIKGYSYHLGSGRTVKSGEMITTSPSGSFTLLGSAESFPFLIEAYLPPDLDKEMAVEVVLIGGNHTETINILMGEEKEQPWYEDVFYSGRLFSYDIFLTYFNSIIIILALLVVIYFIQK